MAVISTWVTINAGQSSNGDVVISDGKLEVNPGGSIASTVVAGADSQTAILSGGSATGTTLQNDGGQLLEGGTAIDTLVASNGLEETFNGSVTSGAIIFKGGVRVFTGRRQCRRDDSQRRLRRGLQWRQRIWNRCHQWRRADCLRRRHRQSCNSGPWRHA